MSKITVLEESFYELTKRKLRNTSILNLFNILEDENGENFLNIFRSFLINSTILSDVSFFDTYEVKNDDWWENISFEYYDIVDLWWIIAMVNDVINPFEEIEEGTNIRILKKDFLYILFSDIERIRSL